MAQLLSHNGTVCFGLFISFWGSHAAAKLDAFFLVAVLDSVSFAYRKKNPYSLQQSTSLNIPGLIIKVSRERNSRLKLI